MVASTRMARLFWPRVPCACLTSCNGIAARLARRQRSARAVHLSQPPCRQAIALPRGRRPVRSRTWDVRRR